MLESLAPLLESGFCGRPDKTEAAAQAFQELWEAEYVRMEEPSDGWSRRIQTCLRAMLGEKSPVVEAYDPDDLPPSSDFSDYNDDLFAPDAEDVDEDEDEEADERAVSEAILPSSPGFGSPIPALIPLPPSPVAGPSRFTTPPPSTPKLAPAPLFTTPTRPHKSHVRPEPESPSSPLAFPDSPVLTEPPRTPMTPKRSAQAQSQTTPHRTPLSSARRRGAREKENVEPLPVIATVAERIAMASPGHSVLGKRPSGDADDSENTSKRQRLDLGSASLLQGGLQLLGGDAPSTPKRHATVSKTSSLTSTHSPATASDSGISLSSSPEIPVYSAKKSTSGPFKSTVVAFTGVPSIPQRSTTAPKTPFPHPVVESEDDVFASPLRASTSTQPASEPRARKRKGVFMEAVEVPTYKEVLHREKAGDQRRKAGLPTRRTLSLAANVVDDGESSSAVASSSRKVQSPWKASAAQHIFNFDKDELPETPTKKRKSRGAVITEKAREVGSSSMSDTLRALRQVPVLSSGTSLYCFLALKMLTEPLQTILSCSSRRGN